MRDMAIKIVVVLFSTLASLVLAEAALRLVGYGDVTPELSFGINTRTALEEGRFETDPDLFWKLPRKISNADRLMKAIHSDQPPPSRRAEKRVLVLGDSCSRLSVRSPPYSALLEGHLLDDGYEVLNASVPGYSSHQGLVWLRTQLLSLDPDVVVVYFGWNDHWRVTGTTDREYATSRRPTRLRLLELGGRRRAESPLRVPLPQYRENLEAIVDESLAAGARVVLVAAPHRLTGEATRRLVQTRYLLPSEDPTALHARYLQVVRSFAGRDGVAVLAADKLLELFGSAQPLIMRDGIHLTDEGHTVLAAALALVVLDGIGADGRVTDEQVEAVKKAL
jgi:lysophospholipase L1-like esterase